MATEAANRFYKSTTWKKCRDDYYRKAGGLCERCLKKGLYNPGEIVHHKEHINANNLTDPRVLTDFNNLMLLCRRCHAEIHDNKKKRYRINESGQVITE